MRSHSSRGAVYGHRPAFMVAVILLAAGASVARAQLFGGAMLVKNVHLRTPDGETLPEVDILIKGERIAEIGEDLDAPLMCQVIDATGMTVTPGLIDTWSSLGRLGDGGSGRVTGTAWDLFDRFGREVAREALRQGVTAIFLSHNDEPGINGRGAAIALAPAPAGAVGKVISEGALCINLGSGASPISRLEVFDNVYGEFRKAREYREALDTYEEELEDYLKALEERNKEEKKDGKGKNGPEKKGAEKKNGGKGGDKEGKGDGDGKDEKKGENGKNRSADDAGALDFGASGVEIDRIADNGPERQAAEMQGGDRQAGERQGGDDGSDLARRRGRRGKGNGKQGKEGGEEKKGDGKDKEEDELKKPVPPKPDRDSEMLLRAMDRELVVRVRAHRSADILNALDLARDYNLRMQIEGATEAALVVDELKEADVGVILEPVDRPVTVQDDEYRRHQVHTANVLEHNGVDWTIGSGGSSGGDSRFVGFHAQMLAGYNSEVGDWLTLVTRRSAGMLGLPGRGSVSPGNFADLVIWEGDPADPGSKVNRVYIGGKLAYVAKKEQEGEDE